MKMQPQRYAVAVTRTGNSSHAAEKGMEEKSRQFVEKGAEVYTKV